MSMASLWQAEEVVKAVQGESLHEQSWQAGNVAIDSRQVKPGDLFVALKGPTHDAHAHVASAFVNGASAAVVSSQPQGIAPQVPLVFVQDTFQALQELGAAGRKRATGSIIAVTGSVGKTGTKEMLRLMLGACGETYANEGSFNNHWGVPLSLARLPREARFGVFELGMNHAGELDLLSKQVQPQIALITTVEAAHMEFFAALENVADAKAEIFNGMPPSGAAILNRDNSQYARLLAAAKARGLKKHCSFGRNPKSDAQLIDWLPKDGGSEISVEILGKKLTYYLAAPGEHLALNSLGALLACAVAGGDVETCAAALSHYRVPQGRGVIDTVRLPDGDVTIIDESYNASPAAMRFAIKVLGQMMPGKGGRRLLALGEMRELGEASPALHAEVAADIVANKIDLVFSCGAMMAHMQQALPPDLRGGHTADSAALAPLVAAALQPGDIITVKGSKSTHMEMVIEALRKLARATEKMAG